MIKKTLVLVVIALSVFMISCKKPLPNKNYEDFEHIDHWDQLNDLTDEETFLFYYSPFCPISRSIEDDVTEYFVILENDGLTIYLIHEGMIYQQGEQPLEIIETPSILIYENKEFKEIISGSKPVLDFLEARVNN